MIDALVYAVRDGIYAANIGFQYAECNIMDDGRPPPRTGQFFAAIHDAAIRSDRDNQLHEYYEFKVTLTMRVVVASEDRLGDQQIYRNLVREKARQQGFYAKADRLKTLIHMNWQMTVQYGNSATTGYASANDNLLSWVDSSEQAEVYGFCEPMRFLSMEFPKVVGGEWFTSDPESEDVGVKSSIQFGKCRRFQPQTQASGPFV